jgi:hypothetical protein
LNEDVSPTYSSASKPLIVVFLPVAVNLGFSTVAPPYFAAISAIAFVVSPEMRMNFFCAFRSVMVSPVLASTISVVCGAASMRMRSPLIFSVISVA